MTRQPVFPWTEALRSELVARRIGGEGFAEIAADLSARVGRPLGLSACNNTFMRYKPIGAKLPNLGSRPKWPDEDLEAIRVLWVAGLTGTMIALRLAGQVSRPLSGNIIAAMAHRYRWAPNRPAPKPTGGRGKVRLRSRKLELRRISTASGADAVKPVKVKPVKQVPLRVVSDRPEAVPVRLASGRLAPVKAARGDVHVAGVPLVALPSGRCRWPYFEGADTVFCAAPAESGRSWCSCHAGIVFDAVATAKPAQSRVFRDRRAA